MKKSEIRRLVAKWRDLKQRSRNHELSEKLKEIEHRYYHETGKKLEEKFDGYSIPSNFVLTASYGGKHDAMIVEHGLKYAEGVYSEEQADALGFEIDHDDYHAAFGTKSFALLIHGTQPKGSMASQALQELKRRGWNGYSKRQQLATA